MTDIALNMQTIDGVVRIGLDRTADGIADDSGLTSAVMVRLFTDKRADDNVRLDSPDDKRGFFGDALLADERRVGSLLWTLYREKVTDDTLRRIEDYTRDALADLVEDNIIKEINVTATADRDRVSLVVEFIKSTDNQKFSMVFDNTIGAANDR